MTWLDAVAWLHHKVASPACLQLSGLCIWLLVIVRMQGVADNLGMEDVDDFEAELAALHHVQHQHTIT